jgi:CheY-like chemotaxis protein
MLIVRALIVDDEDELRAILSEALQNEGVQTIEAKNGLECLWQVKHEHPDVIVLDLTMPRLGGLEALKRIHTFDPRIRVIVLTASSDPAQHQAARTSGASEVYTKPYDLDHLAQFIAGDAAPTVAR